MKIAFVIDIYNDKGNGTSKSARCFVEQLRARGHEVIILCQSQGNTEDYDADNGIVAFPTLVIPFFQNICEKQHAVLAKPNDELIRKTIATVDIVHIYLPFWLGTHCAKIASELGVPTLGCYHLAAENITCNIGLSGNKLAAKVVYDVFRHNHYKSKWIKDIHCPSRTIASTIYKYHYYQNLHIISNGYNPDFKIMDNVTTPEEYKGKFVIVSVGRHTKEKRQDLIIKAVAASKYRDKTVLVLAGSGPLTQYYTDLAIKLKVNCVFAFYTQEELIRLLNCADLFIQASSVETESISCLEAIACGVVPIISNSKMCATQQFALVKQSIFRNGRKKSLAKRINYWYEHEKQREQIKQKYARFATRFSLQKSIDSILEVYNTIINRDPSDNEHTLKDYNNRLVITLPRDGKGAPIYRHVFHRMLQCKIKNTDISNI